MGYYSSYTIASVSEDTEIKVSVRNTLLELSGYTGWHYERDELRLNEAKWYDHLEDMKKLSIWYPELKFEMHCRGEDGDESMIYAFNGQVQRCGGHMVFGRCELW